jgi:NlpE N-terminal domain
MLLVVAVAGCESQPGISTVSEPWYPSTNERGDPILAVFEGRVPCADPEYVKCEKIKVALVLYHEGTSRKPTTYKLARVYVAASPEGSRVVVDGAWTITKGTKLDPAAPVYKLDASAPQEFRSYWVIDRDILFILDEDLSPRVGTASWSYVLNRIR